MRKSGLAFHCHHNVLCEYVYDYDERVEYIKGNKPEAEQSLRLRLFQLVPEDEIPRKDSSEWKAHVKAWSALVKASLACDKTWIHYGPATSLAYAKAWEAYDKSWDTWDKAWKSYDKAYFNDIIKLHSKLCPDCPFDGKSIFPPGDEENALP